MIRSGAGLIRIESASPIRFSGHRSEGSAGRFALRAVVQHLHYAGRSEWMNLKKIACPEPAASAKTAAVLVPVGKSAEWWKLSQDERQILFQKTIRHEGISVSAAGMPIESFKGSTTPVTLIRRRRMIFSLISSLTKRTPLISERWSRATGYQNESRVALCRFRI